MSHIKSNHVYMDGEYYCHVRELHSPDCDIPLLRKHLEWVEAQAELPTELRSWKQNLWFKPAEVACGSYRCFAGNVAHEAGAEFVLGTGHRLGGHFITTDLVTPEGKEMGIGDYAAERLGINPLAANALFSSTNTANSIRQICEAIAGERL